jgi:hypothetical protein
VGVPASAAIAAVSGVALAASATGGLDAASRLASSFLLGSTLTAMLLGHYYLTAPAMSIEPLKRFVRFMAVGLVLRAVLAGAALALLVGGAGRGACRSRPSSWRSGGGWGSSGWGWRRP